MALQALGSGIEPVRTRPGMFIGDTQTPTHLAEEILDNSIDEVANGFATKINIFNNSEDGSFWVCDNGRGIPMEPMKLADGSIEDSVKVLCTELFSGTKFDTEDYSQLIGMHGVGLVAVNALSEWMTVKTRDRKDRNRVVTYSFVDGILQNVSQDHDNDLSYSTIVGFKPNPKYFSSLTFDNRYFIERLITVQSKFNLDGFTFNNHEIPKMSFENYVRQHLSLEESESLFTLQYSSKDNANQIKIYATYLNQDDSIILGNVNLRNCDGKFINSFQTELKKSIGSKIDKSFSKINDKEYLNGLRAFILINIPEPKFDSQTKVRMVSDIKKTLLDPIKSQIDWFSDQILDVLQENLERKLHQKIVNGTSKSNKSYKRVAISKLRDCQQIPGKVLYIVEGDSAYGTLKKVADKKIEACYPLRGKVLNVESSTLDKIQKNKEISDILTALGPINNRRYKSIKILADADSIGGETPIVYMDCNNFLRWDYIKNIKDISYVQSMDRNNNIEWKKVLRVIKHKYDKKILYRIKSRLGHYIDCTEDHVIYVFDSISRKIEQKSATQINLKNDHFICPKYFPSQEDINHEIDITPNLVLNNTKQTVYISTTFERYNNDLDDSLVRVDIRDRVKYTTTFGRTKVANLINFNKSTLQMYDTGRDSTKAPLSIIKDIQKYVDVNLQNAKTNILLNSDSFKYLSEGELHHHHKKIRNSFTITSELAYLIGFYIGDGCRGSSKNNPFEIQFSYGNDKDCELNITHCCETLGFTSHILEKKMKTCYIFKLKSIEFDSILDYFGLTKDIKAWDKFIPQILFSCNEKIRMALLMGLFHSDGCLFQQKTSNRGFRLNHNSTSKKLQIGINILLRQFGIVPILQEKKPRIAGFNQKNQQIIGRRKVYCITINKIDDLKILKSLCESFNLVNFSTNLHTNGDKLESLSKTTYVIPIKSIEKIEYHDDFVYDLEVESNNNFATSTLGAIYHNSDGKHISVLVLLAIAKFASDYIKSGQLSVIIPPLYGAEKGGKYYPVYDNLTLDKFKKNNYLIRRFKGLGEMNRDQLEICIRSGFEYKVSWPENEKQLNNLINIITNTALKKAIMNSENVKMSVILNEITNQLQKTQNQQEATKQ